MTYNVFGGTLSFTQSINQSICSQCRNYRNATTAPGRANVPVLLPFTFTSQNLFFNYSLVTVLSLSLTQSIRALGKTPWQPRSTWMKNITGDLSSFDVRLINVSETTSHCMRQNRSITIYIW